MSKELQNFFPNRQQAASVFDLHDGSHTLESSATPFGQSLRCATAFLEAPSVSSRRDSAQAALLQVGTPSLGRSH